jgi:hypothetical protein
MPKSRSHTRKQTPRSSDKTLRGWSRLLKMPALCDNAACRTALACRGPIRTCAPKHFANLPEGVQGFACVLWEAKTRGLSFDEAMEGFPGSRAEDAWNDWCAQVAARQREA